MIRNLFEPLFINRPYNETLNFNVAIGTVVSTKAKAVDSDAVVSNVISLKNCRQNRVIIKHLFTYFTLEDW